MNMGINQNNKGFSLLELSIVLIIASIMIAISFSAKVFVRNAKVNRTLSLTLSSPINDIDGLDLWLEPNRKNAFMLTGNDNISIWYDFSGNANDYFQYNSTKRASVKYDSRGFNGVRFDAGDFFELNKSINCDSCTAFFVFKYDRETYNNNSFVFYNGDSSANGWGIYVNGISSSDDEMNSFSVKNGGGFSKVGSEVDTSDNLINIVTYARDSRSSATILRRNGQNLTISNSTSDPDVPSYISYLGTDDSAGNYFSGELFEIIIYSRPLKANDYSQIEDYLIEKYRID